MMLQGHFVDSLLDVAFSDPDSLVFSVWQYFRGITAPVFFTVSGFIFTYLLVKVPETGLENSRIKKGVRRGLQLILIGYLLRLNLFGLLKGTVYDSFFLVDVLHCIGFSILCIIGLYLLTYKRSKLLFPVSLLGITSFLFIFEPIYATWSFSFLPDVFANYFTRANGSVFTLIPWIGYTAFGGFLSIFFNRFKEQKLLYPIAISASLIIGASLILFSSDFFVLLSEWLRIDLFKTIFYNNYLFIRMGDVLIVFAVFMLFRSLMKNKNLLRIGQNTLSVYVVHFIILYGSFTGVGLYLFLNYSMSPVTVIVGAIVFMVLCSYLALLYDRHEENLKLELFTGLKALWEKSDSLFGSIIKTLRSSFYSILRLFGLIKA